MPLRAPASVRWRRLGLAAGAALVASYFFYGERGFAHGGSRMGIAYGTLGLLAILVLLYFGVRKRSYRSTWGTLEGWLQSHIYLGLLAALLILFHTGFRFHDRVAVAAFVTLLVVVGSGLVGTFFYTFLPRRLSAVESDLSPAAIAAQLNQLADAMARVAAGRSQPFQQVCKGLLDETIPRRLAGWKLLFGAPGVGGASRRGGGGAAAGSGVGTAAGGAVAPWAAQLPLVPAAEQEHLRHLLVLSRQRGELLQRLLAQQRYRNLLDAWLYIHLPLSVALLVLVAAHLVAVFYFSARP